LPQARAQRPTRTLQLSVSLVATAFPNHIISLSVLDSLAGRRAAVAASQCHDFFHVFRDFRGQETAIGMLKNFCLCEF
jgi:hypothetical protein